MLKISETDVEQLSQMQIPVVGIGASAGGLDAVKQFLQAVPEKSGMAYVFVQHLSPKHESVLPDILKKSSKIPVHEITNDIHLEKDNLYILPSNKIVTALDGVLKLAPLDTKSNKVKIIDLFFSSLASVHQSFAVGVVLSGYSDDGTIGLQAIKAYGGITFAQDGASAEIGEMPKMAISSGAVDFVLPPAKIAEYLVEINSPFPADYSLAEIANTIPRQDDDIFKQLLTVIRVRRGVDFTYYKISTIKRRIIRRMALNGIEKTADYLGFLRENIAEQDALYNDILISVTAFFRDPSGFELLCNSIFPDLMQGKSMDEPLRIWIAGCATGEEAYTMAICLHEQLGNKAHAIKVQLFATDISETAINKARSGIYRASDLEGMSASRLQQFFTRHDGYYQVNKEVRDMCVFAHHNILKDPPFSKIDLVSCRNVMIYLEPVLQKKALTTFHYSLNEKGYLMLGRSESIGVNSDQFGSFNTKEKIFRRKGVRGRFMQVTSRGGEQDFKDFDKSSQREDTRKDVFKLADQLILASYAPAGVLLNENFDIIQFRGATDLWLTLLPGVASLNIIKMARDGLAFEIRNLLQQAKKTNASVRKMGVVFTINGLQKYVNLDVSPIKGAAEPHYLILFENSGLQGIEIPESEGTHVQRKANAKDLRIRSLEKEILQARADMKTVTQDQESVFEELQTANQELLSGSEELQTLNEELETSKEELLSTNEEITIVNNELLYLNEQLNNAINYTEGIINTINDPLIILDKDLKVKRATNGFYNKFQVTEKETEGKFLYELGNLQWDIPALRDLLGGILPDKNVFDNFEVSHDFPGIGQSIMNLNARKLEKVADQLILLAINDITESRRVQEGLAKVEKLLIESKERLKFAVDSAGLGTMDYNPIEGKLILDDRCKAMLGLLPSEEIDYEGFISLIHPDDKEPFRDLLDQTLSGKASNEYDTECRTAETDIRKSKWLKLKGEAFFNEEGIPVRAIGTLLDITVQKIIDDATNELLKKKDEFISIASHELKTPITSLKLALQIIENTSAQTLEMKPFYLLIHKATKQVNKITELIKNLLDVTRLQSGNMELDKSECGIRELIYECIEGLQYYSSSHEITVEGEIDLVILCDRDRLEQVITNLLSNAIKYSPGSNEVIIRVYKMEHSVKFTIIDFGIGIETEKIPFVFDRFFRVEQTSQNYAGMGLGLYISSEIIKRHKGTIGITSKVGDGSTVWFTIPDEQE